MKKKQVKLFSASRLSASAKVFSCTELLSSILSAVGEGNFVSLGTINKNINAACVLNNMNTTTYKVVIGSLKMVAQARQWPGFDLVKAQFHAGWHGTRVMISVLGGLRESAKGAAFGNNTKNLRWILTKNSRPQKIQLLLSAAQGGSLDVIPIIHNMPLPRYIGGAVCTMAMARLAIARDDTVFLRFLIDHPTEFIGMAYDDIFNIAVSVKAVKVVLMVMELGYKVDLFDAAMVSVWQSDHKMLCALQATNRKGARWTSCHDKAVVIMNRYKRDGEEALLDSAPRRRQTTESDIINLRMMQLVSEWISLYKIRIM